MADPDQEKGLTKENAKKLLRFDNSWRSWLDLFMIAMVLVAYYGYRQMQSDFDALMEEIGDDCPAFCEKLEATIPGTIQDLPDFSNLTIT